MGLHNGHTIPKKISSFIPSIFLQFRFERKIELQLRNFSQLGRYSLCREQVSPPIELIVGYNYKSRGIVAWEGVAISIPHMGQPYGEPFIIQYI